MGKKNAKRKEISPAAGIAKELAGFLSKKKFSGSLLAIFRTINRKKFLIAINQVTIPLLFHEFQIHNGKLKSMTRNARYGGLVPPLVIQLANSEIEIVL